MGREQAIEAAKRFVESQRSRFHGGKDGVTQDEIQSAVRRIAKALRGFKSETPSKVKKAA